ncbi:hypothetical protein [Pyruvatibacter sp.]|uniref:hypothetical protein n=1 Tax=Pyruvatibacter sp. TaxID=1981328 RepID=UPI0032EFFA34
MNDGRSKNAKPRRSTLKKLARPLVIVAGTMGLAGCAAPVIGAITVSQLSTAAGIASSIMSGRDLTEHVVSAIVGEDCRFLEAILRGRPICVPYGSPEADDSFQGIIVALNRNEDEPTFDRSGEYQVAGLDPTAVQLGFAPIVPDYNITTNAIAAVERDITNSDRGDMRRVSFGMMSATYGPSHSMDDLLAEQRGRDARPFLEGADVKPAPVPAPRVILAAAAPTVMPQPLEARRSDGAVITPDLPSRKTRIQEIIERAQMAPIPG